MLRCEYSTVTATIFPPPQLFQGVATLCYTRTGILLVYSSAVLQRSLRPDETTRRRDGAVDFDDDERRTTTPTHKERTAEQLAKS